MQQTIDLQALRIQTVWFGENKLFFDFADGRSLGCPLIWFPKLAQASPEQRLNWRLIGGGKGVHWESIDEDLSAEGMFLYKPV